MNRIDTDFEDEVRRMLGERAADISDQPRADFFPTALVRPAAPIGRSRRPLQIAVAAAAVLLALTAGLVLRPDDTTNISTALPAKQVTGLPSVFDSETSPVIFSAPGDADAVVERTSAPGSRTTPRRASPRRRPRLMGT